MQPKSKSSVISTKALVGRGDLTAPEASPKVAIVRIGGYVEQVSSCGESKLLY